jgi:hypothetical protein
MYRIKSKLKEVPAKALRPTQMTVGFKEVKSKRQEWAALGKKKRRAAMSEVFFPAVIGPKSAYYILDHHHLALALVREQAPSVQVGVVKDLSDLNANDFWIYLDHLSLVHPYDQKGRRCAFKEMPVSIGSLRDDPYRSLAGGVRDAGGFAKADEPYLEFLWTNFFRNNIAAELLTSDYDKALKKALRLAISGKAQHLPGWAGTSKE